MICRPPQELHSASECESPFVATRRRRLNGVALRLFSEFRRLSQLQAEKSKGSDGLISTTSSSAPAVGEVIMSSVKGG